MANRRHDLQLLDRCNVGQLSQFQRSVFGSVKVLNALIMAFAHSKSVSNFQSLLIRASKQVCQAGSEGWQDMFATTSLPLILLVRYCFV